MAILRAVRNWQAEHESPELVRVVLYDEVTRNVFCKAWQELQT
jgi:O-acetyl-ADP-ribose deacetylase (regulator of RNase III)